MLFNFFDAFRKRRAKADTPNPTWKFTPVYEKSPTEAKPTPVRRERKDSADLSQFLQLSDKIDMEGILKILTKDHDIVHYENEDFYKAKSGWYAMVKKGTHWEEYIFSDLCAAGNYDRGDYDDLFTFDRIEFNMAGLAGLIQRYREKPASPYASIPEKLRAVETDSEKQLIIQKTFGAQDWKNIDIKIPGGTVTIRLRTALDDMGYHRFYCGLDDREVFFFGTRVSVCEELTDLVIKISECLPFIEQYVPQAPPEILLAIIRRIY